MFSHSAQPYGRTIMQPRTGELRLQHQLVVPLGEVLRARRELFFGHAAVCPVALGSSDLRLSKLHATKLRDARTEKRNGVHGDVSTRCESRRISGAARRCHQFGAWPLAHTSIASGL